MNGLNPNESGRPDMYVKIKTADICTKGRHPEDILSNLCGNDFCFDGVQCGCMESFLQALKYKDVELQRKICLMKADEARRYSTSDWQKEQMLWWKEQPINRQLPEFMALVCNAYEQMYLWCERFRDALMSTMGKQLLYDSGRNDPHEAILTDMEFCNILTDLRESRKKEYGRCIYARRWPNSYGVDEDYEF